MELKAAAVLAGVNLRTAYRWLEEGLIELEGYDPKKWHQGKPLPWTEKATVELRNLANLRTALSLQALKRAAVFLRKTLKQNPYSSGSFFVLKGSLGKCEVVKVCTTGEAIQLLRRPGQIVLIPVWEGGDPTEPLE